MFEFKKTIHSKSAFTLIEMIIVLIIIGILLMVTIGLSWNQIQKVKNKTVKESILSEWQSRYSRNLWSSSFAWTIYDHMNITITWEKNSIDIEYIPRESESWEPIQNTFTDRFIIKKIIPNYKPEEYSQEIADSVMLQYTPYQLPCKWWDDESTDTGNLVLIMNVNDNQDYCFQVRRKNCRLVEMSESACNNINRE